MPNTCPICKQSSPEEAQFCPICGYSFSEQQNDPGAGECPSCGEPYNFPEPAFCGSCGYQLSQPESAPFFTPQTHPNTEDSTDNISEEPATSDDEEVHIRKNTYLTAAAVTGILVVIGIILIGVVMLLQKNRAASPDDNPTPNMEAVYTAAWETAIAGETIAISSTTTPNFTAAPSPTLTPMPTPSLIPTVVPVVSTQKGAEEFIYFYWGLIDKKDFATAWLYQSPSFKSEVNHDNFDEFANGFQYTGNIAVLWVKAVTVTESEAIVDADLQFMAVDNKQGSIVSHRYTLIKQNNQWMMDNAIAMSTRADPCSGTHGGRLHAGDIARILAFQLSVRDAPGGEQYGQRLNVLAQGQEVTVVEEPVCMSGMYFVKVQSKIIDEVGWVAEGDSKEYYLEPVK